VHPLVIELVKTLVGTASQASAVPSFNRRLSPSLWQK
jgi:hypothetical protein